MSACALALVLLLDASASIFPAEWQLQAEGHAAAFEDAAVQRAITRGPGVAVAALSFSDEAREMVPWRILRSAADAQAFATALREAPRGEVAGTDIGGAIFAALDQLATAPCAPEEEVIDLVTDGESAEARTHQARAYAEAQGVRVNALGVGPPEAGDWLREHAITPGGFAMAAPDWASFAAAIRRKVTLELAQAGLR
ncbi:DUF1194 domain-containing protein [Roseococcus sp. SDR]|uniref:DUF1194 domain-containing protein n=1 Tax=Roseococcus sp. SDR TaxID=2835532 RepID=UPI001BCD4103|nr:DUF1194 domain-containing protein [Roseococcus sp. SDR]MBS7788776.1 DUF1194 domain-containing protein [Roseococcus sp. SDR]MBV1844090.1 DUF1194 domain-containing protein [Roseococcus sp. SDR]